MYKILHLSRIEPEPCQIISRLNESPRENSWLVFFFFFFCSFNRNLLRPTGVGLQEAVFTLRVYRAEDLPQSKLLFMIWLDFLPFVPFFIYSESKSNYNLHCPRITRRDFFFFFIKELIKNKTKLTNNCEKGKLLKKYSDKIQ